MPYRFGEFELIADQRILLRNAELVPLAPKTIDLLIVLVENAGRLVTKEEISARVWEGVFVDDSSISKNISILRKVLREPADSPDPIRTLPKRGYQFMLPLEEAVEETAPGGREAISFPGTSLAALVPDPRKRWLPWMAGLGFLVVVVTVLGLTRHAHRRPVAAMAPVRGCVAILDFTDLEKPQQTNWLATALPVALETTLERNDWLRFVGGDRVAQSERELSIADATAYTRASLDQLHQDLGCETAITGAYLPSGDRLRIDVQAFDLRSGKSLGAYSETGNQTALLSMVGDAGGALRKILHLPNASAPEAAAPADLDSIKLYAEGLRLLRAGKIREAQVALSNTVVAAPSWSAPHAALAEAWSQLGFDNQARQEAKLAFEHSGALPPEQKLVVEARYHQIFNEKPQAIEEYARLMRTYPDAPDYPLGLAAAQISSAQQKDALATLHDASIRIPEIATDARLHIAQAQAYKSLEDYRNQLLAAGEAIQLAHAHSSRFLEAQALLLEGNAWVKLGNSSRGQEDFAAAAKISEALNDDADMGLALTYQGEVLMRTEEGNARPLFDHALALERESGSRRNMIAILNDLAANARGNADMYAARGFLLDALALTREIGDGPAEAQVHLALGNVANNTGDPDGSLKEYAQARDLARTSHQRGMEAIALGNAAGVELSKGDLLVARQHMEAALAIKRDIHGDPSSIAYTLQALADLEIVAGNLGEARQYDDQQAALNHSTGLALLRDQIQYCILAIEEGNPAYAEEPMTQLAAQSPKPSPGAEALRVLALSWLARGDLQKAREVSDRNLALARKSPNIADYLVPAEIVSARIDAARGNGAQAAAELATLLRDTTRLKNKRLELEVRLAAALVARQRSKSPENQRVLVALAREAQLRGFGLVARKAITAAGQGNSHWGALQTTIDTK